MDYVSCDAAMPGTLQFADMRNKRLPVTVSKLPFAPTHYKRLRLG